MLKTPRLENDSSSAMPVEAGVSSVGPWVAEVKMALEAWALQSSTSLSESERMKAMIEEFDGQQIELERVNRAGPEPGPRGEIYFKDMTPTEQRLTVPALIRPLDIHFQHQAVESVFLDTPLAQQIHYKKREKTWHQGNGVTKWQGRQENLCKAPHRIWDPRSKLWIAGCQVH